MNSIRDLAVDFQVFIVQVRQEVSIDASLNEMKSVLTKLAADSGEPVLNAAGVLARVVAVDAQLDEVLDEFSAVEFVRHHENLDKIVFVEQQEHSPVAARLDRGRREVFEAVDFEPRGHIVGVPRVHLRTELDPELQILKK